MTAVKSPLLATGGASNKKSRVEVSIAPGLTLALAPGLAPALDLAPGLDLPVSGKVNVIERVDFSI